MQAPHVIAWSFENFPTSSTILQGNFKVWYVSDTLSNKTQARMADLTKGEKVEGVITNVSTEQKLQFSFSLNKSPVDSRRHGLWKMGKIIVPMTALWIYWVKSWGCVVPTERQTHLACQSHSLSAFIREEPKPARRNLVCIWVTADIAQCRTHTVFITALWIY